MILPLRTPHSRKFSCKIGKPQRPIYYAKGKSSQAGRYRFLAEYPLGSFAPMSDSHDFYFQGTEVGFFRESEMPRASGRFRYEPYRGPVHYDMQTVRRTGGCPRCYYDAGDVRVTFTVRDSPEYGVLELCDFEFSSRNLP